MVQAHHVIFSTYGFWLPNDPRGSWSDFVGAWDLVQFGRATKTDVRHSVAAVKHDVALRRAAKSVLKYPPVRFSGIQARAVARGIAEFSSKNDLTIWACAILPQHIHMVIARHRYHIEQIINLLKGAATRRLLAEHLHPFAKLAEPGQRPPTIWGRGQWSVFLDSPEAIARAIQYVESNPIKDGKPPQNWSFVTKRKEHALPFGSRLNKNTTQHQTP